MSTKPGEVQCEFTLLRAHQWGFGNWIATTIENNMLTGDGLHPQIWAEGECHAVHGQCDPMAMVDPTDWAGTYDRLASLSSDQIRYDEARDVIQLLDCVGSVAGEIPMDEQAAPLLPLRTRV